MQTEYSINERIKYTKEQIEIILNGHNYLELNEELQKRIDYLNHRIVVLLWVLE